MGFGYVNIEINCINADIENATAQMEAVFENLSGMGLGDIFRDAVMGGSVNEGSFETLSADVAGDLKEAFNGVSFAEMAPGVFMVGGPAIRITSDYPQGRSLRALMIKKIFAQAASRGNHTAVTIKEDLSKLAALSEKIDLLKKQKAFLIANTPALKIA